MHTGIRLKANVTDHQRLVLSQWMGCARFIWNSKCDEYRYHSVYARKYCPVGTYAPVDQQYSQFKNDELSPWLSDCPSQILRNSASNWFDTFQDFKHGRCGKPRRKKKTGNGSIHLTRELFRFDICADGVRRLFIGTKRNNIGYLSLKLHKSFEEKASLYIKKRHDEFWVSFCYDDGLDDGELLSQADHLKYLRGQTEAFLQKHIIGMDRGVKRPIQAGEQCFDFSPEQKRNMERSRRNLLRYQKKMSRQVKGSNRRQKIKVRLSNIHNDIANIRKDFCHKVSRVLVDQKDSRVFILEDLKTRQMTKRSKAKKDDSGRWLKNGGKAKSGLNKAILNVGWHLFEEFLKYKAHRAGKAWFKVPAHHTSQECAVCAHTHPGNRKSQEIFLCESCGHTDNADHNAAEVIKKRAISLVSNSGSELSKRGVLSLSDTGRGATDKSRRAKSPRAPCEEASKKKRKRAKDLPLDFSLEASPL
ncbi:RNA-guided endonuclease InsQ/TnpB family protein [Oligoflexus tunisiensis]|uniref:RNA-guided endonuclease InsQ/TnpB family protein n=1 Tax=Oligoflexus tunisiensis TaxID=708132 RepID=UPI00114CA424|nr:RNA-guided endonuclease TnpB family protein [Oligoflexus tunisiensis]